MIVNAISSENVAAPSGIIAINKWLQQTGVTPVTGWRWRKNGWLKTVNICGRVYVTAEAIEEFTRRAIAGEFSSVHKVPRRTETDSECNRVNH